MNLTRTLRTRQALLSAIVVVACLVAAAAALLVTAGGRGRDVGGRDVAFGERAARTAPSPTGLPAAVPTTTLPTPTLPTPTLPTTAVPTTAVPTTAVPPATVPPATVPPAAAVVVTPRPTGTPAAAPPATAPPATAPPAGPERVTAIRWTQCSGTTHTYVVTVTDGVRTWTETFGPLTVVGPYPLGTDHKNRPVPGGPYWVDPGHGYCGPEPVDS